MYLVFGLLFCLLEGILVGKYGWSSTIWSTLGFLIGLFSTANIVLPILMGYPLSFYHLVRKEIRPKVFLSLLYAPLFWCIAIFLLGYFIPSLNTWIQGNIPFQAGNSFGFFAIILTPLFKKGREDFKSDYDKNYGKYYTKNQLFEKEITSLTKLYTNLFLESERRFGINNLIQDEQHKLKYLVFCLYISIKCVEDSLSDTLGTINKTMEFLSEVVVSQEFMKLNYTKSESAQFVKKYLLEFEEKWGEFVTTIKNEDLDKSDEIMSRMVLFAISDSDEESDLENVTELGKYVNSSLYIMRQSYDEMMLK